MKKIDFTKCKELWVKYEYLVYAILFLIVAMWMRVQTRFFVSGDMDVWLLPWYDAIKEAGGVTSSVADMGDYTCAYKYLIAFMTILPIEPVFSYHLLSSIFDVVLAVFVGLIVRKLVKDDLKALLAYAATLFLPNVFLNSAVWGQCDCIFTSFCMICFYFMLSDKYKTAFVFYGIAISFKIQAIFLAPLFAIWLFKKPSKQFFIGIPFAILSYFLMGVPAVIMGAAPYTVWFAPYLKQMGEYSSMNLNTPNFYYYIPRAFNDPDFGRMLVYFALGVCAITGLFLWKRDFKLEGKNVLLVAYFYAVLLPFILPHMHERYLYLSDIFALIFVFVYWKKWYIGAMSIVVSIPTYCNFLFNVDILVEPFIYILFVAIILLFRFLLDETAKKTE